MTELQLRIILSLFFFVMSVLALTGKSQKIMANYNTPVAKYLLKYDQDRLYKITGVLFIVLSILLIVAPN